MICMIISVENVFLAYIFVATVIFQKSLKFNKKNVSIWNIFCNIINVFIVMFDHLNDKYKFFFESE